jgi:hypothetical protein
MKKQFIAVCALALAASGCAKIAAMTGADHADTAPAEVRPAMTLSEPVREVQPAPHAVVDASWERNVARDIPYFNMSSTPIAIYSDAERTRKISDLAPGSGGFVETCSDASPVCKIAYADATSGWVKMDHMGGITN